MLGPDDFEDLLSRWNKGDRAALEQIIPLVHEELPQMARSFSRPPANRSMQTTAVIHEAYLRLSAGKLPPLVSCEHFFSLAGRLMRNVMVDYARARLAAKRGGPLARVELRDEAPSPETDPTLLLAVDQALQRLALIDPRQARIVELRYFAGLEVQEVAAALDISPRTDKREWACARAWLANALKEDSR